MIFNEFFYFLTHLHHAMLEELWKHNIYKYNLDLRIFGFTSCSEMKDITSEDPLLENNTSGMRHPQPFTTERYEKRWNEWNVWNADGFVFP